MNPLTVVRGIRAARSESEALSVLQEWMDYDRNRVRLTDREIELLHALAEGYTNQEISKRLYMSVSTVKSHTATLNNKLGVHNRTSAVTEAIRLGLLTIPVTSP
jgi:LuxR family maltose regulon positive regulatory protein